MSFTDDALVCENPRKPRASERDVSYLQIAQRAQPRFNEVNLCATKNTPREKNCVICLNSVDR